MKNGFITATQREESHGDCPVMLQRRRLGRMSNIHAAKIMLCIWWDQVGVIYYELLKLNETITEERYQTQLMRLSRALCEKCPQYEQRHEKVILQHENARPHIAKPVKVPLI